jgi:carboxyl-terminal processing protease
VFGSKRTDTGQWSYLLPPAWGGPKLGFVRLGVLDVGAASQVRDAVQSLEGEKVKGIVLDLRGCPGGYVSEAALIAEQFVPSGKALFSVKGREGEPVKTLAKVPSGFGHAVPLVVLVDATTQGGGELIAAAIRDNDRAPVAGQRTFGKGVVMTTDTTGYSGLLYRLTTGIALRPDGTDRHRYLDSKATDPWGVRPDPGYEIATTRGYADRMNGWYELHTIRPWKDPDATPLDDPLNDPVLGIAAKKLGEVIRRGGQK